MQCKYKSVGLEELKQIVSESITYSEIMRKLGYTANRGNSFVGLKKYLKENQINISHLKGKAHGTSKNENYSLRDILVKDTPYSNMSKLKQRVINGGLLEYKCSICGINTWLNKPLTLQLDHINGDNRDNRIENLRLLCPNCHSQTDNFCGKKRSNSAGGQFAAV